MVKSLRWQLQIWHAIVLTGVLAMFGTVVYNLHWQTRLQQIDAELDLMADILGARVRRWLPMDPRGMGRPPGGSPRGGEARPPGDPNRPPREEVRRQDFPAPNLQAQTTAQLPLNPNPGPPPLDRLPERPDRDQRTESTTSNADRQPDPSRRQEARRPETRRGEPGRGEPGRGEPGRGGRPPWDRNGPLRIHAKLELPEEIQPMFEGEDDARFYFVIWGHDGHVLEKSASAPDVPYPGLLHGEDGIPVRNIRQRDQWRESTHVTHFDVNVLVGRSIRRDLAAEHRYGMILFLAGSGVLAAGCLGGGWLTASAIRPLASMTRTARSISAQNLTERIDTSDTAAEFEQLADVLNETFDRLQAAFEQQSRFTADASHELRTPLAVILAHTELALSRVRTAEEYRKTLETCARASSRMKSLIEDLLLLARFDSKRAVLETNEFDLAPLVLECVEMLQPLAEARQIRVTTQLEPTRMKADRNRLAQVLTNLLTNAIRYNVDSGKVEISVATEAETTVIRVQDTGTGIAPEDLPHLFERFYRVDKARSRSEGGSGLGLSICKTIVECHGGIIHVTSEPQHGTCVEVRLPNLMHTSHPTGDKPR